MPNYCIRCGRDSDHLANGICENCHNYNVEAERTSRCQVFNRAEFEDDEDDMSWEDLLSKLRRHKMIKWDGRSYRHVYDAITTLYLNTVKPSKNDVVDPIEMLLNISQHIRKLEIRLVLADEEIKMKETLLEEYRNQLEKLKGENQ